MQTISLEVPDVVARALDQAAASHHLDRETLIAEGLRQLPCFQRALSDQPEVLLHALEQTGAPEGFTHG